MRVVVVPDMTDEGADRHGPHAPTRAMRRVGPPVPPTEVMQSAPRPRPAREPMPARPAPEAATPRRRSPWRMALLTLAAVAAVAAAIVVGTRSVRTEQDGTGGVATETPDAKHPPQKDVAIDGCALSAAGVSVDGTVRNPTGDVADYVIQVHLVDPGGVVITAASIPAPGIAPETRTTWSGTLPPVPSNAPSATCKVVQVDRYRAG
jgi:hypothetical protein